MMAELANDLGELQKRLKEVNGEYRPLVRNSGDAGRLRRMAKLRKTRLELMTSILNLERPGGPPAELRVHQSCHDGDTTE
jgi:hypothetical protein